MNKKVTTAILVALIAISSIVAAFAASGKQGYISPKAIVPGAITSVHIKDDDIQAGDIGNESVTGDEIAQGTIKGGDINTGAVSSDEIADNTTKTKDLASNAIPTAMYERTATLKTTDSQSPNMAYFDAKYTSWDTTIDLPPRDTNYNLSVYWTGNCSWFKYPANHTFVRCQLVTGTTPETIGLDEYKIADPVNNNSTTSCVFHGTATQGTTPTISIQIRSNNANGLAGVNDQILFVTAYPKPP